MLDSDTTCTLLFTNCPTLLQIWGVTQAGTQKDWSVISIKDLNEQMIPRRTLKIITPVVSGSGVRCKFYIMQLQGATCKRC